VATHQTLTKFAAGWGGAGLEPGFNMHTYVYTDRQADRQTNRKTHRWIDKQRGKKGEDK
jgi:hypothetical protein